MLLPLQTGINMFIGLQLLTETTRDETGDDDKTIQEHGQ